ncbi:MAG: NADH-quinone oxidoreductase subunit C [Cyclobacteriaceae bacterium]|nr:NADH-quinone oxidoreductase subunit C [Cyclobacteriaceae bacterium]UYN87869.1 MAG: NADH-quinone oxidoreductase subunit C [Cyclobacteriaceae bacterium]
MDNEALKDFILQREPEAELAQGTQYLQAVVPAEKAYTFLSELKSNPQTSFDYLFCQTGVDWPQHMEVVYHLKSTTLNHVLVVKAKISSRENPEVDTVCNLWRTAEFHEREIFDLYGIVFKSHPDLRRLLLTDEWVGHPLRKDYIDPVNMIAY